MSEAPTPGSGRTPLPDDGGDALAPGTRLAEFEIREVLGVGGFGIVYRAWDDALQRDVALKEYMPTSLAVRGSGERVTLRARVHEEDFALGLRSFVNEARLLARFDQPALVKVFRFWEGNGTAYMAMPLYQGRTLRQLRKERGPAAFNDAWMRALIEPLLGALEVMHDAEIYHRDIAPDNILWCDDGRPVLLDFGAARLVLADRTQNVTAILKPQFAPIEQYAETPAMRQGPWTDLYALAGTCFFMLTGRAPLPATARVLADEQEPLARIAPTGCSPRLLQVLDWALAVRPQDRPQSVAQFRDALAGRIAVPPRPGVAVRAASPAATASAAGGRGAAGNAGYEKTIQVGQHTAPAGKAAAANGPASAMSGPVTRAPHDDELERPERSVMLPPTSRSPLATLLILLVLAGAAAGGWATRGQWMPLVGLQAAAPTPMAAASAAEAVASAVAPASAVAAAIEAAASAPAPAPAQALPAATDAAASAPAPPASEAVAVESAPAPAPVVEAPPHPAHAKPAAAHARPAPTRPSNFVLPPPVLPPANEAQVGGAAPATAKAPADHTEPTAVATTATPSAQRGLGPREACADQDPTKLAACIKRLCDSEPRYQRFPICQRVHRKEELQGGTAE